MRWPLIVDLPSAAAAMASAAVRPTATCPAASAIKMNIAAPVVTSAPPATPYVTIAIITAITHDADASRQGGQHGDGQPDLDPASQVILLVHRGKNTSAHRPAAMGCSPQHSVADKLRDDGENTPWQRRCNRPRMRVIRCKQHKQKR